MAPLPDKERKAITFGSTSLAFATIIQFVVAGPFYPKALKTLNFSRVVEMDLLIVLSTSAAYMFVLGFSEVDEFMLTGESRPIEKFKGSSVIAGSINGSGVLTIRLTRIPGEITVSTIAGMVDEAKLSKPKIQEIADQVATYFVPVVISITIVVFCIWIAIGVAVQNRSGSEATIQAITYAITVLIVSCPCAIGLAVPMVIVVATGIAAERGVIFKSADAIEIAYKTTHVVFGKTGTLTQGKLIIAREEYLSTSPSSKALLLGLIGSRSKANEPVVMFCGDGTNDAFALAQATIGVHMNEGTDIAKSAADVVLMRPRLSGIFTAITVSRKSIHRIAFNFGWSFVYNVFAILIAAGAIVHARIPPEFAGLGELVSVLPVVAAGILLRWAKI
ncbi:MAG: hypothetical protein Q9166_007967 [cf. Caloplaca sp. 2 TL-2023]